MTATVPAQPIAPTTAPQVEPLVITAEEAAPLLRSSIYTVRRRLRDGSLPSVKLGGKVLIPFARLKEMLNGTTER